MNLLNSTTPSTALVQAFRRTLRPLVRLMLASGVTYPLVSELLKQVFVEVADREFGLGDKAPTDSRISLISGVHRKDVRRLRSADQSIEEVVPNTISFGGKLVTTWLTDERFRDEEGRPRPLSKVRTPGAQPCFEDLVESRRTDIRLRVVRDEWLRLGIVHIDAQDRLVLNTDAFVPQAGIDEKLFFFAHNLHDHAAAATDNLLGSRAPQLERSLMYDGGRSRLAGQARPPIGQPDAAGIEPPCLGARGGRVDEHSPAAPIHLWCVFLQRAGQELRT
jgi:hypothetical protein